MFQSILLVNTTRVGPVALHPHHLHVFFFYSFSFSDSRVDLQDFFLPNTPGKYGNDIGSACCWFVTIMRWGSPWLRIEPTRRFCIFGGGLKVLWRPLRLVIRTEQTSLVCVKKPEEKKSKLVDFCLVFSSTRQSWRTFPSHCEGSCIQLKLKCLCLFGRAKWRSWYRARIFLFLFLFYFFAVVFLEVFQCESTLNADWLSIRGEQPPPASPFSTSTWVF